MLDSWDHRQLLFGQSESFDSVPLVSRYTKKINRPVNRFHSLDETLRQRLPAQEHLNIAWKIPAKIRELNQFFMQRKKGKIIKIRKSDRTKEQECIEVLAEATSVYDSGLFHVPRTTSESNHTRDEDTADNDGKGTWDLATGTSLLLFTTPPAHWLRVILCCRKKEKVELTH